MPMSCSPITLTNLWNQVQSAETPTKYSAGDCLTHVEHLTRLCCGSVPALPPFLQSYCGHNHDPSGAVSRAAQDAVPISAINERMDDIGRWTRAGVKPGEIFKLLEIDQEGKVLCRDGKKKASFVLVALGKWSYGVEWFR